MEADPELSRRANELVATWCTAAALLSLPPLALLARAGVGQENELPTWALVAFAVYGFLLVCVGGYPFEKLKSLGEPSRHPGETT